MENARNLFTRGQVCISSVHWGLGLRALGPVVRYKHAHTEERRRSIEAYRTAVLRNYELSHILLEEDERRQRRPSGPRLSGRKAMAVHITRAQTSGRWLETASYQKLVALFSQWNVRQYEG